LAFSSNGYNWTGYDPTSAGYATPVFTPSLDPARFDCDHIGWFKVIKNSPTDWEAFYSGGKDSTYQALNGIGYATSPDGINWTRVKTLCTTADGVAWRSQSVWMPSVVKIGSNYRIWFIGSDNPNIGSSDWIQWRLGGASAISVPLRLTATGSPNPASVAATVNFTAAPTGGFPSYTYDWDFGDGSAHGNVQNPSHTYSAPGVYTVRVMVTDDIGNTAKDTITLSIVYSAVGSGASPSHGAGMGYSGLASRPFQPVELPNLSVQSASLSSATVEPNTPVTLTALVGNKSTVNGAKNIKVYVNGQEETSTGVTINSGETRTMTFSVSRSQPGTYTVYVDSTPAGSFTVKDSTGTVLLVLSAAALLAALLGLVYLARRRQG
jgi:PKD repeat protein